MDFGKVELMESRTTALASLAHTDGLPLLDETFTLGMDGKQDIGV
ncbi:MAG: hypothetical protein ACI82F_000874 [Planctomycetota bacterium]|jgi:hypothetical protein